MVSRSGRLLRHTHKNGLLNLSAGNDLPVQYLRLLAPPLQLLSAAVWQVVQQGLVDHYGMLEEFVTMVTELVPELMSYSQKAQLIMGLRARVSSSHGFSSVEVFPASSDGNG